MDLQLCVLAYRHSITSPPPSCLPLSSFASARRANRFTRTCFAPVVCFFRHILSPSPAPRLHTYAAAACVLGGRAAGERSSDAAICRSNSECGFHVPRRLGGWLQRQAAAKYVYTRRWSGRPFSVVTLTAPRLMCVLNMKNSQTNPCFSYMREVRR